MFISFKVVYTLKALLQNKKSYDHETMHEIYVLKLYKLYINDDPELTLTYFTVTVLDRMFQPVFR